MSTLPRMLRPLTDDQRVVMERKWAGANRPAKPQKPCDIGLFSDEGNQLELLSSATGPRPT